MPPPKPPAAKAPPLPDYKTIAAQYARAKRLKEIEDAKKGGARDIQEEASRSSVASKQREALEAHRKKAFSRRWGWTFGFWVWMLFIHAIGIFLFTSGFLLTRLVLDEKSSCAEPPIELTTANWVGKGTVDGGCWHPKSFDRAVVILIDALRYDFTVPVEEEGGAEIYHNALPFLHETAVGSPNNAFLRPFIADPPTSTLQRLKGLTTGTLPTFVDLGSNFAGTAIEEDNLLMQFKDAGKKIVHLGDDTWTALFPGYFEPNISRAYDSFNVWDLHTVDNGVLDHIFPLMESERRNEWDVLIGHFLGVDHAGHRYGPSHIAMKEKLQQMDKFVRKLVKTLDDNTLLVVMGDHGMDAKGDHGGESDDEVEAALWMYSKRPYFGRTRPEFATPPKTAKIRPVNQIDLVPTLALLLGIPIPYNNLGRPIEEAFASVKGTAWNALSSAFRTTAAGIRRYQASYFAARGIEQNAKSGSPAELWNQAEALFAASSKASSWQTSYEAFAVYQEVTLKLCKDLWARFDIPRMILGIAVMVFSVVVLFIYVSRDEDEDFAIYEDSELEIAEKNLELQSGNAGANLPGYQTLSQNLVRGAALGAIPGSGAGLAVVLVTARENWPLAVAVAALGSIAGVFIALFGLGKTILNLLPNTIWGWLAVLFTVSQSVGFASNSYTIWEDSILLFFITTFGFVSAIAAFRIPNLRERALSIYHSVLFVVLGRLVSFSKLCREEQMPYCKSTYYASATSSTSATWQLVIPLAASLIIPSIVKSYLTPSRSYEGLAPTWIGYVFRGGLALSALYWALDAADNGDWFSSTIPSQSLQTIKLSAAQLVLAIAVIAGTTAFTWAPPCVSVVTTSNALNRAQVVILGYANANGARYLLLPINVAMAAILLSKPMGGGAIALMLWQVLSLAEILDLNGITSTSEVIGPIMLGVLGNFHFFKTGHQATLSSIQWDSAFIPLSTIRYPWTPLVLALNTFAGQIIAAVAVPLLVLWKTSPKRKGVLESVSRALGAFVAYYAVESLATMAWAGHLRRHLMLYRVFGPRFMTAAAVLLVVDLVGIAITLTGVRTNSLAVSEVFGWAD